MITDIRKHVALAVVILVLAALILVLTFIPHRMPIQQFQAPPSGGIPSGSQNRINSSTSPAVFESLPPLAL